jgi:hypothetical protein
MRPRTLSTLVIVLCLLVTASQELDAQRRGGRGRRRLPEDDARLKAVKTLMCTFTASTAGTWTAGQPRAQTPAAPGTFTLNISGIDVLEGTAESVGLGAPSDVTVKLVGSNLHVLDIRQNGALAVTTVFADESRDGRFKAVHSRSEFPPSGPGASGPEVSQWYGDCEAK